jgi:hypothetical protein
MKTLLTSPDQARATEGFGNAFSFLGQSKASTDVPPNHGEGRKLPSRTIEELLAPYLAVLSGANTQYLKPQTSIFLTKSETAYKFG